MKKRIIYSILFVLIVSGCAQIGKLSGGEKDTEPPILLKSKPLNHALNFNNNKLIFSFDEFFGLNNINAVFLSSPPLLNKPEFKLKRKNLIVELDENLKDTTTYMFWFGDVIEDYHEKNPLKAFKFVFSTGDVIDTMEISGSLKDAYTLEPDPDLFVMLYRDYNDSTPINETPYYITKSDTAGNFKIDYIKAGNYRIFALKDLDANMKFSLPNEKIAFLDTFIVPKVISETKVDTFKAGSVLHVGSEEAKGDTLVNDTVIISQSYIYLPKNIKLFTFEEDNNKQYIISFEREVKGKCFFEFNKPVDSVLITGLNFQLNEKNHSKEKVDSGRSLSYWIKDKELFNKDTLSFTASYFNFDSVENRIKETDTLNFIFKVSEDTIKRTVTFEDFKTEQDSFENYIIETITPIKNIDTSTIKLFEVLDTLVVDKMEQKLIKAYRPAPAELDFSIKRPFVDNFFVEALNFDTLQNWCQNSYLKNNTVLNCKITNKDILEKDTLKLVLHYDNDFFKGQKQDYTDTLSLALFKQGLVSVVRPSADTIKMKFKKTLASDTKINIYETEGSDWYSLIKTEEDNHLTILIKDKKLTYNDTLLLTIRTKDFDNTSGDKIDFEYSKNAIFIFKKQKINRSVRKERNNFYLVLNKPLHSDIRISPLNFTINNDWYNQEESISDDTIYFQITDKLVANMDTIRLAVNYMLLNRYESVEEKTDTINLIYKRQRRSKKKSTSHVSTEEKETEKLESVSINIPVKYKLLKDSLSERKYHLSYPWRGGKHYLLKLDSLSLTDFYNDYIKEQEIKFEVRKSDAYSNLNITLSNIGRINKPNFNIQKDSTINDSLILSKLDEGQIILYLFNDKKELIKTDYTSSNTIFSYNNLIPGSYSAKLIYDRNSNEKWDSGKYLKNRQAERVFLYSEGITLSAGEETEILWNLD